MVTMKSSKKEITRANEQSQAHSTRRKALVSVGSILTSLTVVLGIAQPVHAARSTDNCAGVTVISVRGTDAPRGVASKARNGRVWEGSGFGPILVNLAIKLESSASKVNTVGLIYPAAGGVNYAASIDAGKKALIAEVNWLMTNCSVKPKIVLLGHSQGAHVIFDALTPGATANGFSNTARAQIKAIAAFGDPTYVGPRSYSAAGNAISTGVISRGAHSGYVIEAFKTSAGTPKVRSWCYEGDAFCTASGFGSAAMAVHNSYLNSTTKINQAYNWIVGKY